MRTQKSNCPWTRAWLCIALLSLTSLSGCSKVEWAVRFADTYLAWKLDDHFDLSGESKSVAKKESKNFVLHLREQQLPEIAKEFTTSSQELTQLNLQDAKATKQWLENKIQRGEILVESALQDSEPYLIRVIEKLDQENWHEFFENFEEQNEEILERKDQCESKFSDHVKSWMGSTSDEQRAAIKKHCEMRSPDHKADKVKNRNQLLQQFKAQIASPEKANGNAYVLATQNWFSSHKTLESLNTEGNYKIRKENLLQTITTLLGLASEKQKQTLIENLQEKGQGLKALSLPAKN